jgi:hypothetical protein
MPADYVRLITAYLRRHSSEEEMKSATLFFLSWRTRDPNRIEIRNTIESVYRELSP